MKQLPKVSIIIVTYNNERTILQCANSICSQFYPKKLIELVNVDGGSTDDTTKILSKFGFRTIVSSMSNNAEAQRAIGLREAKNNLIVSIDADNYLPNENWLRRMIQPFVENPDIVHAGTMHFTYRKDDTIYNRYCALFGVLDPVVFYIGRPDRIPQHQTSLKYGTIIKSNRYYDVVTYTKDSLTTVGCNGVVYKKDILLKYSKSSPKDFLHIDVFSDLIDSGFNKFAIVKTDIIHDTAISIPQLIKKRISFLHRYYLKSGAQTPQRRYLIYNPKNISDRVRLYLFILYTLSWIRPTFDSVRGYMAIADIAWFLHPIMCWVFLYSYFKASINNLWDNK
jgi:glycosyltransferase involved in cell wall biosynthesis